MRFVSVLVSFLFIFPSIGMTDACADLEGAAVVADDGKYLGKLTSQYSTESIFNEYGNYGSEYSINSIWNEYGNYGSEYSSKSPFNEYTRTPPKLIKNRRVIGFLTVNDYIAGAVHPIKLGKICYGLARKR